MDLLRILDDVRDGKVTLMDTGAVAVTSDTQVDDDEQTDYITVVRLLLRRSWVMESGRGRAGGAVLRLTTVGEIRRLELDTARAGAEQ